MELVSILIPAYNIPFFEIALQSALAQTYPSVEIIVCDDSPGTEIQTICESLADPRLTYVRNTTRLGFGGNFTECFNRASGTYIKFLNDDDLLLPGCVARMVEEFESRSDKVTLVTSRRRIIDGNGALCPDVRATAPLVESTTLFNGLELGARALIRITNFIGEPSTPMFRKSDVDLESDRLFMLNGTEYVCLADLSLWLRLMRKGSVVYIAESLSHFRNHPGQLQTNESVSVRCVTERYFLVQDAQALGFLALPGQYAQALNYVAWFFQKVLEYSSWSPDARRQLQEVRRSVIASCRELTRPQSIG